MMFELVIKFKDAWLVGTVAAASELLVAHQIRDAREVLNFTALFSESLALHASELVGCDEVLCEIVVGQMRESIEDIQKVIDRWKDERENGDG